MTRLLLGGVFLEIGAVLLVAPWLKIWLITMAFGWSPKPGAP